MRTQKRFSLRETSYRFLFEQEEEGDTEAADIFADEEGEDDEETDAEGEAEGDADADADTDEEKAEEEEEVEVSPAEQYELSDSIDQELDALFVDFEEEARKSAVVNKTDESIEESVYRRLFEVSSEDIDLHNMAANVARLVKNYQNLIDWESVILNKAESFINNHYGEDTARVLMDILEDEYDIGRAAKEEDLPETPIAVGATSTGAG
jgi:hypothetical protein